MENVFRVLGGGNTIGTSCYYLQVDNHSFLLDCGASIQQLPHLPSLQDITNHHLDGLWQLDKVILSHAHFDHIGALPYLAVGEYNLDILCNPITKILIELQLNKFNVWEKTFCSSRQRHQYEISKERVLSMIRPLGFEQRYECDDYAITLYPAGHIPGAAMVYIETKGHKILYTGDFSNQKDLLCKAYKLPSGLKVDMLIVEGTHAYGNQQQGKNHQGYANIAGIVVKKLYRHRTVTLETSNVTKGIELARYLEKYLQSNYIAKYAAMPVIYLEKTMFPIVDTFEQANYQVYSEMIKPLYNEYNLYNCIVIKRKGRGKSYGDLLDGDLFTLHAGAQEITDLINRVQATTTLIVHAVPQGWDCITPQLDIKDKTCLQTYDGEAYYFS